MAKPYYKKGNFVDFILTLTMSDTPEYTGPASRLYMLGGITRTGNSHRSSDFFSGSPTGTSLYKANEFTVTESDQTGVTISF